MQAVHLACALARSNDAALILLRLIPVTHPGFLGTDYGIASPTGAELRNLEDYAATAEDYAVQFAIQPMQYVNALDAVLDAAEELNVDVVFAHVPNSRIPYWQRFQIWRLERQLSAHYRRLFTLIPSRHDVDRIPSIVNEPVATPSHR